MSDQAAAKSEGKDGSKEGREDRLLTLEYQWLWTYYVRTLDEKHKTISYFLTIVATPGGFIAAFVGLTKANIVTITLPQMFYTFLALTVLPVLSVIGLIALTTYVKEHANGTAYLDQLKEIRRIVRLRYPAVGSAFLIDTYRAPAGPRRTFGDIGAWRSGFISALNSALVVSVFYFGVGLGDWEKSPPPTSAIFVAMLIYLVVIAFHVLWGHYMFKTYRKEVPGGEKRT